MKKRTLIEQHFLCKEDYYMRQNLPNIETMYCS